jgi:hypothetical protein
MQTAYLNVSFSRTSEGINNEGENSAQWQVFRELGSGRRRLVLEVYLTFRLATEITNEVVLKC